ncbi:siroheme decarboxylase subunit beta [Rhodoblastus sp.]|uniref:siroheme decarboxylase subunit beta n=1 Tax=Rhodoblastus sp. TaxID=1962975 RepID=UPI003F9CB82B
MKPLDDIDRALIRATQAGLPFDPRPYARVGEAVGLSEGEVIDRFARLIDNGIVRRIGVVPNHFRLGLSANGMTVWDVADDEAERLGAWVGALDFVSHCYLRPRAPPDWPYNLFAMVHGATHEEAREKARRIADLLGPACRGSDILFSTRILKKTGLRLAE